MKSDKTKKKGQKRDAVSPCRVERHVKPCNSVCDKCGSNDIVRHYYKKGDEPFRAIGERARRKNEFINYGFSRDEVLLDHIHHHCRCCQNKWETHVIGKA